MHVIFVSLKYIILLVLAFTFTGCDESEKEKVYIASTFTKKESHYRIELDFRCGKSNYEMGAILGRIYRDSIPDFEQIADSYLYAMFGGSEDSQKKCIEGMEKAKSRLSKSFKDELEGAAAQMSGTEDDFGDGELSPNEYLLLSLEPDMGYLTLCSGMGVSPKASATGKTLAIRAVDWPVTEIVKVQTVLVRKYASVTTVGVGYAGLHTGITTVNSNGMMVSSYMLLNTYSNIDEANASFVESVKMGIEQSKTAQEFTTFVKGTFATHVQIMVNDIDETLVVESDRSGTVDVRRKNSELQDDVQWGIEECVPVVNTFLLKGKSSSFGNSENSARFNSMRMMTDSLMQSTSEKGEKITGSELQKIFSFCTGDSPGKMADGDLYNSWTQQIVLFDPLESALSVWFIGKDGAQELEPHFESIDLPW